MDLTCRFLDDLRRRLVVILCRVTVMLVLVSGNFYLPTLKQLALLWSALSVALSSGFWYFYLLEMMVDLSPPSLHPAQPDFPLLVPWQSSYQQDQADIWMFGQKNRNTCNSAIAFNISNIFGSNNQWLKAGFLITHTLKLKSKIQIYSKAFRREYDDAGKLNINYI